MFFSHYSKLFTLFSIWFFIIYISYISYKLLSQSGKHSVDLISATSRRFWANYFLEIKEWILLWYPKNPIGCSWGSKNIWCSRIWGRIFVSWKYFLYIFVDYISFSFYIKYIRRKCYKNFLGHIFFGLPYHSKVNNTFGCGTAYTGSLSPHISSALLFLHEVAASTLLSLLLSLFSLLYFLSSSWYFSFLLISPPWWHSKIFMCFLPSFIVFLILLFHQGSNSFLLLLPRALRPFFS